MTDPAKYGLERCGPGALVGVPAKLEAMGWKKLLTLWLKLMKAVESPEEEDGRLEDVGWWYGERTLTGLLAGATWRAPRDRLWWVLEEFTSERTGRRLAPNAKLKKKSGRGDLWLGLECRNNYERQFGFTIEAKQTSTGQNTKQAVASIENGLLSARGQLRKVQESYRHGLPLAICYYWPAFPVKWKNHPPMPEYFFEIAGEFRGPDTMVAVRWCDYDRAPTPDAWIYPGVVRSVASIVDGQGGVEVGSSSSVARYPVTPLLRPLRRKRDESMG